MLLLSRDLDPEFALVRQQLTRLGIPVVVADAEMMPALGFTADLDRRLVRIGRRWISPTVTWIRHFTPRAMPARRTARMREFAAQSWQALGDQLGSVSGQLISSSGPGLVDQLAAARAAGIAVPRTVVTTDPVTAAAWLGSQRVIVKALHEHLVEASPGLLSFVLPEITEPGAMRRTGRPGGLPVVVQEYLAHEAELRCYYVHGQILTFAVGKQDPAAPWLAPDSVTVEQVDPPAAVTSAISALATALSVRYGAFDFLIAGREPVFLELNWAGDWRWFETRARVRPVTAAVTAMLRDLHLDAIGKSFPALPAQPSLSAQPARNDQGSYFDLITFLTGDNLK